MSSQAPSIAQEPLSQEPTQPASRQWLSWLTVVVLVLEYSFKIKQHRYLT